MLRISCWNNSARSHDATNICICCICLTGLSQNLSTPYSSWSCNQPNFLRQISFASLHLRLIYTGWAVTRKRSLAIMLKPTLSWQPCVVLTSLQGRTIADSMMEMLSTWSRCSVQHSGIKKQLQQDNCSNAGKNQINTNDGNDAQKQSVQHKNEWMSPDLTRSVIRVF